MLQHERIAGLKRVPIFAKLSDEALERVAHSCAWLSTNPANRS